MNNLNDYNWVGLIISAALDCLSNNIITFTEYSKLRQSIDKEIDSVNMNNDTQYRTHGKVTGVPVFNED